MRIAVTGGRGFVGSHVVHALAAQGHEVVAIGRREPPPERRQNISFIRADVTTGSGLAEAFAGCQAVIHLVAVIIERGKRTFDLVNRVGSERVAQAASDAGVQHLIHQSANGAGPDPAYPYLMSKWAGEEATIGSGVPFTILRPSLIFGPGDGFFTLLARLIRLTPVTVVVGNGEALFQPIAIDDVTRCMLIALERGASNRVHTIGGPEHLSYDEIVDIVKGAIGAHRFTVHLPVPLVMPAAFLMQTLLPRPPLTLDQLKMLNLNNITRLESVPATFGFEPLSFSANADYLQDY